MKVLILQGGYNEEHKVSLNTGKQTGRALKKLKIDFKNFPAYEFRSFSKIALKDFAGALDDMNKAIQLNPNHPDVLNGSAFASRGWAKHFSGDLRGACSDWKTALSLGKEDAATWMNSSYAQC